MAPVITEEIFQQIKIRYRFEMLSAAESESERKSKNSLPDPYVSETVSALCSPACIIAPYPEKSFFTDTFPKEQETQCEQTFQQLTQVVYTVRNMRGEMQLPLSLSIDLYFFSPDSDTESADFIKEIQNNIHILYALLKVHRISFRSGDSYQDSFGSSASLGKCVLFIPLPDQLQEKEKKRLLKEREETAKKLERVNAQLSNQQFITRAPDSLVRKTRENKKRWETKYSQMEESLKKL